VVDALPHAARTVAAATIDPRVVRVFICSPQMPDPEEGAYIAYSIR
jgi:hypothetical protein